MVFNHFAIKYQYIGPFYHKKSTESTGNGNRTFFPRLNIRGLYRFIVQRFPVAKHCGKHYYSYLTNFCRGEPEQPEMET